MSLAEKFIRPRKTKPSPRRGKKPQCSTCWQSSAKKKLTPCGYEHYTKYKKVCPSDDETGNSKLAWDTNSCDNVVRDDPATYRKLAKGYEQCARMRTRFKDICGTDASHEHAIRKMETFSKACSCKGGVSEHCSSK